MNEAVSNSRSKWELSIIGVDAATGEASPMTTKNVTHHVLRRSQRRAMYSNPHSPILQRICAKHLDLRCSAFPFPIVWPASRRRIWCAKQIASMILFHDWRPTQVSFDTLQDVNV